MADGSVIIDTELDQSGLKKGMSGLSAALLAGLGAAVTAAGTGIVNVAKSSVEAFANYEQLVGGVETLFKESADIVQGYADKAFETVGLSANAYMETVTSFSASLLQSLGGDTEAAAEKANMAITDMADNANKMGTDMSAIQNAYQGFAKQNYTMLDNLKLGYGGTKQEMERLLADAEKLSGVHYDISSYADIVDAIHVVQTEMGITGTTAAEASSTIQGSAAAMKSAWQNVLVGIADENADFDGYLDALVESVATFGENITPRVTEIIGGIGKLVEELAPVISEALPGVVEQILPGVLSAATSLVVGFIDSLVSLLPTIVECAGQIVLGLVQGIADAAPSLAEGAIAAIGALIDFLTENLPDIMAAGVEITLELAIGIIKGIPQLVAKVPQIVAAYIKTLLAEAKKVIEVGKALVDGVWVGIQAKAAEFTQKVKNFFSGIVNGVKKVLGIASPSKVFRDVIGKNIVAGIEVGIEQGEGGAVDAMIGAAQHIANAAKSTIEKQQFSLGDYGVMVEDARNGIGYLQSQNAQYNAPAGINSVVRDIGYSADKDPQSEEKDTKPQYIDNHIEFNGKEVARKLTP